MIERVYIDEIECYRVFINGVLEATFTSYPEALLYLRRRTNTLHYYDRG